MDHRTLRFLRRTYLLLLSLPSLKYRLLLSFSFLSLLTITYLILGYRSYIRAITHEETYYKNISYHESLESQWRWVPDLMGHSPKPLPYNKRPTPLIHDIAQLYSWTYKSQLGLYENKTATYPQQQYWIYFGGTPKKPQSILERISPFSAPNGSCVDSPRICSSFNSAVNKYIENGHIISPSTIQRTTRANLVFADCDVSPLLCDEFNVDPVMFIHMETKRPCKMVWPSFEQVCSVRWRLVPLPLKKMPWGKRERMLVKGEWRMVVSFPSAERQVESLVGWEGSWEGLELEDGHVYETLVDDRREEEEG